MPQRLSPRFGLGSFAYRYAAGVAGFMPAHPLTAEGFVQKAAALGFQRALLCENLRYAALSDEALHALKACGAERGVKLEVGFRGLEQIERHLRIARLLGADTLRMVMGEGGELLPENPGALYREALAALRAVIPALEREGFRLGIENNFELPIDSLVSLARSCDSPRIGLIMDTTNCLGLLSDPYGTLEKMAPYVHSVHLKDFIVRKVEAGYRIEGVSLGEGWLDVRKFILNVEALCPDAPVFLEYGMRRAEGASVAEAIAREETLNRHNAKILRGLTG